jgi:hypothetical protein
MSARAAILPIIALVMILFRIPTRQASGEKMRFGDALLLNSRGSAYAPGSRHPVTYT